MTSPYPGGASFPPPPPPPPPPPLPPSTPSSSQSQSQQQAQAPLQQQQPTQGNPEIYVRRLYKPRLQDQVSIGAGIGTQLASLSRRMSSGGGSGGGGGGGGPSNNNQTQTQTQTPQVLAAEVVQSDFLLQSSLALPEEFGKIYLGETFCAYVSIVNTLPYPILLLDAQASLKSSRSSEIVLDNMAAVRSADNNISNPPHAQGRGLGISRERPKELKPGQNLDIVVEHVLQELDWHYLAIKLEFMDASPSRAMGEAPRPMMKRFKFKVYNPVALTATQRPLPSGEVLIQAQVKNITERHTSLLLEDVTFLAEEGLKVLPVTVEGEKENEEEGGAGGGGDGGGEKDPLDCVAAFDRHVYLQPEDVVQYLYRLQRSTSDNHTHTHTTNDGGGKGLMVPAGAPLGQLRVSWRTTLGEAGTLLSPRVQCSVEAAAATAPRPVELRLEKPLVLLSSEGKGEGEREKDGFLTQGHVYTAHCTLANNSEKDLWLQVQFHLDAMQGVYVTGKSFQNAGLVPAHSTTALTFQLLPLMAGLHDVKGITILDLVTSQEHQQERLCEVMVVRPTANGEDGDDGGGGKQLSFAQSLLQVQGGMEHMFVGSN